MRHRSRLGIRMAATVACVTFASAVGAGATIAAPTAPQVPGAAQTPSSTAYSAGMYAAMQRDLGLNRAQTDALFATQNRAAGTERQLRGALGATFAGAWLQAQRLNVAVTDQAGLARVRAAGADAKLVSRSESTMNGLITKLNDRASAAPKSVTGWYYDVATNSVVLQAKPGTSSAATSFATASGVGRSAVRVLESAAVPRPLYNVRGGDAYYIGSSARCSIGFAVSGGFVSAGHCDLGGQVYGYNQVAMGTFRGSSFPGNDYSWVGVNSNWTPRPWVNNYAGGNVTVTGSSEAAVGATVCRSGSTTGWHCGQIQQRNASVTYAEGTVSGLIRTNVCAEPGDSGGSLVAGSQAQGVTSGGNGNCSVGGTTYFQPVNEILSHFGLSLTRG